MTPRRVATGAVAAFVVAATTWALVQAVAAPGGSDRSSVGYEPGEHHHSRKCADTHVSSPMRSTARSASRRSGSR